MSNYVVEPDDTAEALQQRADAARLAEAFAAGAEFELDFDAGPVEDLPPLTGEIMVVRSLRLPTSLELRAKAIAERRGVPTSEVLREWIADGADRAEAGQERDPVTELHTIADAATRALRALERRREAA